MVQSAQHIQTPFGQAGSRAHDAVIEKKGLIAAATVKNTSIVATLAIVGIGAACIVALCTPFAWPLVFVISTSLLVAVGLEIIIFPALLAAGVFAKTFTEQLIESLRVQQIKRENLELAKRLTKDNAPNVCQMVNHEDGVKVFKFEEIDLNSLTKSQRLNLYKTIFQGLFQIHSVGLCHRNVKCENIVVHTDENGDTVAAITGLIDFLEEEGKNRIREDLVETKQIWSPQQMDAGVDGTLANSKDDAWAAMLMICEMETKVSEEGRMLSPELIQIFRTYQQDVMGQEAAGQFFSSFQTYVKEHPENLFQGAQLQHDYPIDRLVYMMAGMDGGDRLSSKEVLEFFPEDLNRFLHSVGVERAVVQRLLELHSDPTDEAQENYRKLMGECGEEFHETFSVVCSKLAAKKQQEAQPIDENGIESEALAYMLRNRYFWFSDEKIPLSVTRKQAEELYELRFQINQNDAIDKEAKIEQYNSLLEAAGGTQSDFYRVVNDVGYLLMNTFTEQKRQREAEDLSVPEGDEDKFLLETYSLDCEMNALKAILDSPRYRFAE